MSSRRNLAVWVSICSIVAVTAALVALFATGNDLDRWAQASDVASVAIGLIGAAIGLVTYQSMRRNSLEINDAGLIADDLVGVVRKHWRQEDQLRKTDEPVVMSVSWKPAANSISDHWSSIRRSPAGQTTGPLAIAGQVQQIAEIYRRIPSGRLVVLGKAGAGKTVLVGRLVLGLLEDRKDPREPIPVIFSVGSWNRAMQFEAWLISQLVRDYAGLETPIRPGGLSRAAALVAAGRILPILDGFDEVEPELRRDVLLSLNAAHQMPLVMTSRVTEYASAVTETDVLTAAAVIEVNDLTLKAVAEYLPRTAAGSRAGLWDPVLAALRDHPDRHGCLVLKEVLSTPLMVYLCRVIYSDAPGRQPTELLDDAQFPTKHDVESYLFAQFVPAVYQRSNSAKHYWDPGQAARWLTFLARHLKQAGSQDLAWWRLDRSAPKFLSGIVVGVISGVVGAVCLPPSRFVGLGFAIFAALGVGLLARSRLPSHRTGLAGGLAGGFAGGLLGMTPALLIIGPGDGNTQLSSYLGASLAISLAVAPFGQFLTSFLAALAGEFLITFYEHAEVFHQIRDDIGGGASLLNGIGTGLTAWIAVEISSRNAPARALRWSWVGLSAGVGVGLAVGLAAWVQKPSSATLFAWIITLILAGCVGGLFLEAIQPKLAAASTPHSVLIRDRTTFYRSGLVLGLSLFTGTALLFGFGTDASTGPVYGFELGVLAGLVNLIAVGLTFAFIQASWGTYALTHLWLAAQGKLPWRLMSFLDDAHRNRGVLRQAGTMYQFRHERLQKHLAHSPSES